MSDNYFIYIFSVLFVYTPIFSWICNIRDIRFSNQDIRLLPTPLPPWTVPCNISYNIFEQIIIPIILVTELVPTFLTLQFRAVACTVCLLGTDLNWREMIFVNIAWLPKATVQVNHWRKLFGLMWSLRGSCVADIFKRKVM